VHNGSEKKKKEMKKNRSLKANIVEKGKREGEIMAGIGLTRQEEEEGNRSCAGGPG